MGVDISMYLSASQTQGMTIYSMGKLQQAGYEELLTALQNFVQDKVLQSTAYENAKVFCADVLIPLAKGGIILSETGAEACKQFPEEYIAQVDSIDLKSIELEQKIEGLKLRIERFDTLITAIDSDKTPSGLKKLLLNSANRCKEACEETKIELEAKLQYLISFHASSPTIFAEIAQIKQAIEQGISQASQSWNAVSQSFERPVGANMDWTKILNKGYKSIKNPPTVEKETILGNKYEQLFGGWQEGPKIENKPEYYEILRKYFPDMTDSQIKHILAMINTEGCGYVAIVNSFFLNYTGTEETFEKTFGFPMYTQNRDGKKVANLDTMLVDFYGKTGFLQELEDGSGNYHLDPSYINKAKEELNGTNFYDRQYKISQYFGEKNIVMDSEALGNVTVDAYQKYIQENGGNVLVTFNPVNLISTSGKDDFQVVGGHTVLITGVSDNGNLLVSSWGYEWELDIKNSDYKYIYMEGISY